MKLLRRCSKNLTRRFATAASFAALLLASPFTEHAAAKTYVGPDNGLWTTAANWGPPFVPLDGEDVIFGTHSAGTTDLHVTYDRIGDYYNPADTLKLNSITLNSSALNGYMIVNQTGPDTFLRTASMIIGSTVNANTWNQSDGYNLIDVLKLGVGASSRNNTYSLSGDGLLDARQGTIGESGAGTFNQSGGRLDMYGPFTLGVNTGSSGTFNLSGGFISGELDPLAVGGKGTGLFVQSGGVAHIQSVTVNSYGGTATYNMSGGQLETGITVGGAPVGGTTGTGTFNLSGGSVYGSATVAAGGTFNLKTGGVFAGNIYIDNGGLFAMQGGVLYLPSLVSMTGGEFRLNGNSVTLGGLTGNGGIVRSNGGNATLTLNVAANNDFNYGGTITNGTSGVVSLVVSGAGRQTLSGTNSYTGTTTVNGGGTLRAGGLVFPAHSNFILNNGTLDNNGFPITADSIYGTNATLTVNGPGYVLTGANGLPASFSGQFTGNGTIIKVGTGGWNLNVPTSTFDGMINFQNGYLVADAANGLPPLATIAMTNPAILAFSDDQTIGALSGNGGALVQMQNNSTLSVGNNNTDTMYGGKFTADGTVRKIGTGTFTLGGGANDPLSTLSGAGAANFIVAGGTLALNKADGTVAVGGALTLTGGNVTLARGNQIADASALTVNAGTFQLNGFSEMVSTLAGTGGTINLGGGTLTVTENTASTVASTLVGGGTFIKNGAQSLVLTNAANYGGAFTANTGALYLQGAVNATGGTANNGGALNFVTGTANLNNGSVTSNPGAFVQYFGATINNAYLRGSGAQIIAGNGYPASAFNNVTTYNSVVLTQNGGATFNNFTNGGTINNNAPATYSGGLNTITGTINVKSTLATTDFGTSGLLNISSGGTLSNTGSNLVAGGGSRTTVNSGGMLSTASGTSIELNGALLVNNGTQTGMLNVNYGSTAKGTGSFGTVNVTDGGRFGVNAGGANALPAALASIQLADSHGLAATTFVGPRLAATPATNNAASLTLGSNSVFAFDLQNAQGTAGNGYDLVHDTGSLTLAAGTAVGDRIIVSVISLGADGNGGLASNFDPTHSYQFVLVQADGGVLGFDPAEFTVDTTGFQNSLNGGNFSVALSGNNLVLAYNAVPEPGTWAAVGLGSVALGFMMRRRRIRGQGV